MASNKPEAYVSLCCNDAYGPGALAWAQSLRDSGTQRDIVILITKQLSNEWKNKLANISNHIELVNIYDSGDETNLALLKRPELGITFTKLHCWRLTQYEKAVFMDADTLVLQNIDDLFERDELSASPDPGWPDCFNSGVFVYKPSLDTFNNLVNWSLTHGSFDGGDQGLLNSYFSNWSSDSSKRLPYVYNCCTQKFYSYLPALVYFRTQVRVVHFIGSTKPWQVTVLPDISRSSDQSDFLHLWWNSFNKSAGEGEFVGIGTIPGPSSSKQAEEIDNRERQYAWERGAIDYTGVDRFSNIMAKLNVNLETTKVESGTEDTGKASKSGDVLP
jgi:glycogenin glucosyltransferase